MANCLVLLLLASALIAKDAPLTMATHTVLSPKAFSEKRAKAKSTRRSPKKWNKNRRGARSQWGAVKARAKTSN